MLSVALVGLGWWGKQLVAHLDGSDRIRITCAVDMDLDGVREFATAQGFDLTDDYHSVLQDPTIDAVIVATPHGQHEAQVLAAAEAGKQIFCEKPLALSGAAASRMLDACDAAGIVLGIGHERRYEAAFEEVKRMADAGDLGTLLTLEGNWSHDTAYFGGTTGSATGSEWRYDPEQAPLGTLTARGVHITDYFQSLAGPVAEVSTRSVHRSASYPVDDILLVQLFFENGVTGQMCSLSTTPFYFRLSAFGDQGWAEFSEPENVDVDLPARLVTRNKAQEVKKQELLRGRAARANLHAWADAVAGKAEYRFSRDEKLHNVQIMEAIVRSAETGRSAKVR